MAGCALRCLGLAGGRNGGIRGPQLALFVVLTAPPARLSHGERPIDKQYSPLPQKIAFHVVPATQLFRRDVEIIGHGKNCIAAAHMIARSMPRERDALCLAGSMLPSSNGNH